ncbi:MAG: hypothetical protein UY07_C0034G0007 [Parcubacteria group bacterium GW2011_GWA1_47_8]|nr:MAG: hypothetical protein UY07_C0034G0007 [Parcubacteria group bacterium GW2011_GWA1_47_8]KKW07316.1 MAG: hypothetical protein UY42_C0014G0015 [Parcubacteria group bacterium GW2011_GWA2_49_16]
MINSTDIDEIVKFLSERKKEKERELLELKNKLSPRWFQLIYFFKTEDVKREVTFFQDVILVEYDKAIDELKKGNRSLARQLMQKISESIVVQNFGNYGFYEPLAVRRSYEKVSMMRKALAE